MGLFNHFPYTNFHELNLDWIIERMQQFIARMAEFETEWAQQAATFAQIQADFVQIQNEFNGIKSEWVARKAQINAEWTAQKAAIDQEFNTLEASINSEWATIKANIEGDVLEIVTDATETMQAQYDQFLEDYQRSFGVVQERGTSTTDVMSQKTVSSFMRNIPTMDMIAILKYNYFDKDTAIDGFYLDNVIGEEIEERANSSYWCAKMEVVKGKTYSFSRLDYTVCELDTNNIVLKKTSFSPYTFPATYTPTEDNVKYITLSIFKYAHEDLPIILPDKYMALDPGESFDSYIKHPYLLLFNKTGLRDTGVKFEEEYFVTPGHFIETLKYLENNNTPKVIYLLNGVYDIYDELGGSSYLNTITTESEWRDVSVFVPDNTKIIGLGDVTINYLPNAADFSNANQITCVSPINVVWNCEIENVKIYAQNCRYCIHDEAGSMGDGIPKRKKFKNVVAVKLPNTYHPAESYISGQAYASGMITGYSYIYENCYFKSQENYSWTCHTGEGDTSDTGNVITMKNCRFDSPSWAGIRFGSTQGTPEGIQKYCKVDILNCYIANQILLTREAAEAPAPNQYELVLMNCNNVPIRDDFATHGWTNIYTPTILNTIG